MIRGAKKEVERITRQAVHLLEENTSNFMEKYTTKINLKFCGQEVQQVRVCQGNVVNELKN